MLCIKLPCRLICFSASHFLTPPFPWRSHLGCSVSTETQELKPVMSLCARGQTSKDTSIPAVILHSSFYFPLGQRLQSSYPHIHPPTPHPINPPLPHSSDRSQTPVAQSNLIITTNKTLYTSPISSSIWVAPFFPESIIALFTYSYCHIKNSPWISAKAFQ